MFYLNYDFIAKNIAKNQYSVGIVDIGISFITLGISKLEDWVSQIDKKCELIGLDGYCHIITLHI